MKRKRVSKKNKISWRKHVDITDVEEFLEDQRLEERLGPPLSTIKNEELFHLDTGNNEAPKLLSKKEKSKLRLSNPRCFEILKPHTKVPDPVTQRNRVRSKEERKNLLVKLKEEENEKKGIIKAKKLKSMQHKLASKKAKANCYKKGEFKCDIWENNDINLNFENIVDDKVVLQTKKNFGLFKKRVSDSVNKKTSALPTIEPPHPGTSYNPSFEDHQNLLQTIVEKEEKIIKKEKQLYRATKSIFKKIPEKKATKQWLEEMTAGLDKIKEEEEETDGEYKSINPPVKNKKKTLQQRRKQKEQKVLKYFQSLSKLEKKKITDLHRLRFIKEKIKLLDEKEKLAHERKLQLAEKKEKETKRIGRLKYEEEELDFAMPQEIVGNLRNLKTDASILVDRYKSLQKRNIIAPSKIVVSKRPKTKKYIKPGYKDNWKTTVASVNFKPDIGRKN